MGFLGPNGAGKTTTMRAIFGLTDLDAGTVRWNGAPVGAGAAAPLRLHARGARACTRACSSASRSSTSAGCTGWTRPPPPRPPPGGWSGSASPTGPRSKVEALSHGNQQRVQLAAALVHDPELLVLDEPLAGLDPAGIDAIGEVLVEQARAGRCVLFSSHQLDQVEDLCESVAIIDHGRLVAAGPSTSWPPAGPGGSWCGSRGTAQGAWARGLPGVTVSEVDGGAVRLVLDEAVDSDAVLRGGDGRRAGHRVHLRAPPAVRGVPGGGAPMKALPDRHRRRWPCVAMHPRSACAAAGRAAVAARQARPAARLRGRGRSSATRAGRRRGRSGNGSGGGCSGSGRSSSSSWSRPRVVIPHPARRDGREPEGRRRRPAQRRLEAELRDAGREPGTDGPARRRAGLPRRRVPPCAPASSTGRRWRRARSWSTKPISATDTSTAARYVPAVAADPRRSARPSPRPGLTPQQAAAVAGARPLPVDSLAARQAKARTTAEATALLGVILIFVVLTQYITWTLMGVMEEKSSRVVEVLLATVRPDPAAGRQGARDRRWWPWPRPSLIVAFALVLAEAVGSSLLHGTAPLVVAATLVWLVLGLRVLLLGVRRRRLDGRAPGPGADPGPAAEPAAHLRLHRLPHRGQLRQPRRCSFKVLAYLPPTAPFAMPALVGFGDGDLVAVPAVGGAEPGVHGRRGAGRGAVYRRAVLQTGARVRLRELLPTLTRSPAYHADAPRWPDITGQSGAGKLRQAPGETNS